MYKNNIGMNDDIIIRKICSSDKEALASLYDRVWPEMAGLHLEKTSWAIDTSEYSGICAEVNGKIIGSRACFRANVYLGEKRIVSVQFGDSCVDKDYRRFGLFSRMNTCFLHDFFKTKDELIYNVSVDASRKAYEKLGWVYIRSLSNIIRINQPLTFLIKKKGHFGVLAGNMVVDKYPIPNISTIPDVLFEEREKVMKEKGCLHNRYDKGVLKWRLGTDSGIRSLYIEKIGLCLYKTGNKNGLRWCTIGEMFLFEYSYRCFSKMYSAVKSSDVFDAMNVVISHAHPLYRFFLRKGFLINPRKPFLNHGVKVESDKMKDICLNPNNWAIAELDIDTF